MKETPHDSIPELTNEEVNFAFKLVDKLKDVQGLSMSCRHFIRRIAHSLIDISKEPTTIEYLIENDRQFAHELANTYNISSVKMELYINNLRTFIFDFFEPFINTKCMLLDIDYYIDRYSYNPPNARELHFYSNLVIYYIYFKWEIPKFKKCVIAGLVIMHYKLDKYECILSRDEFSSDNHYEGITYERYLYNRIKSRIKAFLKPEFAEDPIKVLYSKAEKIFGKIETL